MSKAEKATEAPAEAPAAEEDPAGKEAIYIKLAEIVLAKTGKKIGKTGGRELFDTAINEIFALATQQGTVRFNGGFGSLHVRQYGAGTRRLPSGDNVEFGERQKLRYEEGVVVKALVENGGNLEEALKVRGSRAKSETTEGAATKTLPADAGAETELD